MRRNYPYIGKSDGVTQVMRRRYPPERYVGIELEVNQQFVERGGPAWPGIRAALVTSLGQVLETVPSGTPDGASDASESSPSTQPSNAPPAQDRERVDS